MSDSKFVAREYNVAGQVWTAYCDASKMWQSNAVCPLKDFLYMPGINYRITEIKTNGMRIEIDADTSDVAHCHQLKRGELNRHLFNIIQHVCNACPFKQKQK